LQRDPSQKKSEKIFFSWLIKKFSEKDIENLVFIARQQEKNFLYEKFIFNGQTIRAFIFKF